GAKQAFIRQVQRHPITTQWLHVDFRVVDLRTPITADVPIVLNGENALVERGQAVATLILHTLHVRALPADLPHRVEADISGIEDFNTVLHVSDLRLPSDVEVMTAPEEPVATLTPSTMAAEEEEITEQEQLGEPELSQESADDTLGVSTE
ncbi:MAG: 50S ribosomal protein L25, partial [Chloroflexota bacterium]|nr:50S ribosomal protein L25 [Chloroflexota bacterium]